MSARVDAILAAAREWLNTPYHHAARVKGAGVDCAQLLVAVFVDETKIVPSFEIESYPGDWMLHREEERFLAYVQTYAQQVEQPAPGDVALFKWGRCFAHGAIVVDWPTVIHADINAGKVAMCDATVGRFQKDGKLREVKFFRVGSDDVE